MNKEYEPIPERDHGPIGTSAGLYCLRCRKDLPTGGFYATLPFLLRGNAAFTPWPNGKEPYCDKCIDLAIERIRSTGFGFRRCYSNDAYTLIGWDPITHMRVKK